MKENKRINAELESKKIKQRGKSDILLVNLLLMDLWFSISAH